MKRITDTTVGRVYNSKFLLDPDIVKAILCRFRCDIPSIFNDDLLFGFIVGGFAKGYAVSDQDIDMFVCVRKYDEAKAQEFRNYYFDLHKEFHLVPDSGKPGELMTLGRLQQKIALINFRSLRPTIHSYYEYEGLLWTEMLTGVRAAQVGDMNILNSVVESCEILPQRWRKEVYELTGDDLSEEERKLSIHRLIKCARKKGYINYVKYGKGFANNIEEAYPFMKTENDNEK